MAEANNRATAEADALVQRDEARHQSQISFYRQLAAQTTARLSDHFDLALLLSVETARIGDTLGDSYEGRDSLLKTLEINPHVAGFLFGTRAAWPPWPSARTARCWPRAVGRERHAVGRGDAPALGSTPHYPRLSMVYSVAFSPDGKTLASGIR